MVQVHRLSWLLTALHTPSPLHPVPYTPRPHDAPPPPPHPAPFTTRPFHTPPHTCAAFTPRPFTSCPTPAPPCCSQPPAVTVAWPVTRCPLHPEGVRVPLAAPSQWAREPGGGRQAAAWSPHRLVVTLNMPTTDKCESVRECEGADRPDTDWWFSGHCCVVMVDARNAWSAAVSLTPRLKLITCSPRAGSAAYPSALHTTTPCSYLAALLLLTERLAGVAGAAAAHPPRLPHSALQHPQRTSPQLVR